ncbi:MAG: TolB family protein [Acidobacteriota bacterium]
MSTVYKVGTCNLPIRTTSPRLCTYAGSTAATCLWGKMTAMNRTRWGLVLLGALLLGLGAAAWAIEATGMSLSQVWTDVRNLPQRIIANWVPPAPGEAVASSGGERQAQRRLAGRLDARLVWSSNRDGNAELYLMDLRSLQVRRLTHHRKADFYARFSPDGERILFLRSRPRWVSFRDRTAWDLFLMNADGTGERRLARQAYHPGWTADGGAVVFERGEKIYRLEIASGVESLLFQRDETLPSGEIFDVALSSNSMQLAMAIDHYGVAVYDLATRKLQRLSQQGACQPTWGPADEFLLWVALGGSGGTRIMRGPPSQESPRVLIDLPGNYSHEYFPTISNDGRWLAWGAAAEGHELDRADYEIFLWKIGGPWERAMRLTHNTSNDNWPDIYFSRILTREER